MTTLRCLEEGELSERLRSQGVALRVGPYVYSIRSNLATVSEGLGTLYGDFILADDDFVDFDVALWQRGWRQRLGGQAEFLFDHGSPFDTIPAGQAYAFLEWGMNWCVSLHCNDFLKLHAATVARNGRAVIMPGIPGAGKSTLCAALGLSGWRVLSDEHALVPPGSAQVVPLYRPVSLKNESIDAIRDFAASAVLGPCSERTHKGVVAHVKADLAPDSHDPAAVPAECMIFPRFAPGESQALTPRRRSDSFILAAYHSFNYSLLCETGFEAMEYLVQRVRCFDLVYHDLQWAVQAMDDLLTGSAGE